MSIRLRLYISKTRLLTSVGLINAFQLILLFVLFIAGSCIVKFVPEITDDQDLVVIEGLITDQLGQNTIKLSTSMPLGGKSESKPLKNCIVKVSDDLGNINIFSEIADGTYTADLAFHGEIGRSYTLYISTGTSHHNRDYQSEPVIMKPVPPIDNVYYEKVVLDHLEDGYPSAEGCNIYLNTHDPENNCRFYRWEYTETWEFSLPYYVPNAHCWITEYSDNINIKNTTSFSEDRITRQPVISITNETDRLIEKYSILINQYSLTEDEYLYWEKLQNIVEHVGGLYDLTPASIPGNIFSVENPDIKALGYFSVSSVKSARIFIDDQFRGLVNLYEDCEHAVVGANVIPSNLGATVWIIIDHQFPPPAYRVLTFSKGCADCTTRGITTMPDFWNDEK